MRAEFDYLKGVVTAVHLYYAYQVSPDPASLDRLLNAIDARRSALDKLFTIGNELKDARPKLNEDGVSQLILRVHRL